MNSSYRNVLLSSLPNEELSRLEPYIETTILTERQTLVEVGGIIPYVWFPDDAVTSTVVTSHAGDQIEVGLMGLEGMAGLSLALGATHSSTTVLVQIPGRGHRIPAPAFLEHVVAAGGPLYNAVRRYTDSFVMMVAQVAACNRLHAVEQRFSRWLLQIHDRVGRDDFPLTHEFAGSMLGSRRASVSIVAGELQRQGAISYVRGKMHIVDRTELERRSCECYRIIAPMTARREMGEAQDRIVREHVI